MTKLMCNNTCKTVLKLIVTAILIFFLISKIDWLEVWGHLKGMKVYFVVLFIIFYLGGILISAKKWQVLASFKKFKRPYFFYFKTYLLGTFLNNFFPSFVGGDAYRVHSLGKKEERLKDSSTTVVIDRISGLIAVIFLAAIFGLLNYKSLLGSDLIFWLVILMSVISLVFLFGVYFFNAKVVQKIINYLPRKIKEYIKQLGEFRSRGIFFRIMDYSALFVLVGIALANYMLFLALGVQLSFFDFLSITFLANIIASIPISMGNIGIKEWAYIFLFGVFGVGSSVAVTVVIIARVLQMLVSFIALPFYLRDKNELK